MKIIFLDIDGVLISFDWGRLTREKPFNTPDPRCVGWVVRTIEDLTKAGIETKVVICSTWVWVDEPEALQDWLLRKCQFSSQLHVDMFVPRGDQPHETKLVCAPGKAAAIKAWLEKHPEVTEWVVVDDEPKQFDGAGFGLKVVDTVNRDVGFDYRAYCAVTDALRSV